jgi:DNA-binding response OmpR family regulator
MRIRVPLRGHMPNVMLVDADQKHAECIRESLVLRACEVDVFRDPEAASTRLRRASTDYEVVILNVSNGVLPWITILAKLQEACFQAGAYPSPLFLCTSNTKQSVEFEIRIERTGARYVYEG